MGRSLYICTKNRLFLFIAASVLLHAGIFSAVKINPGGQAGAEIAVYKVRMKTVAGRPVSLKNMPELTPALSETSSAETSAATAAAEKSARVEDSFTITETALVEKPADSAIKPRYYNRDRIEGFSCNGYVSDPAETETGTPGENSGGTSFEALDLVGAKIPRPPYPDIARRWGHEGIVLIEMTISKDGRVSGAVIIESSGYDELDKSVMETVLKKWKFPWQGREVVTRKEFEFRLNRS